jgi:hypothetical protein
MTEIDLLEQKNHEHVMSMTAALTRGSCKDFGEYQRICGVIYGLSLARMDIQDLRQKMEHMDE